MGIVVFSRVVGAIDVCTAVEKPIEGFLVAWKICKEIVSWCVSFGLNTCRRVLCLYLSLDIVARFIMEFYCF